MRTRKNPEVISLALTDGERRKIAILEEQSGADVLVLDEGPAVIDCRGEQYFSHSVDALFRKLRALRREKYAMERRSSQGAYVRSLTHRLEIRPWR